MSTEYKAVPYTLTIHHDTVKGETHGMILFPYMGK